MQVKTLVSRRRQRIAPMEGQRKRGGRTATCDDEGDEGHERVVGDNEFCRAFIGVFRSIDVDVERPRMYR